MKKPRVLLDVDGVLADFVTPALQVVQQVTGKPAPKDATDDWDLFRAYDQETQAKFYNEFKKEGWCYALQPYPGALEGVNMLRDLADVYFVTSPMHGPHWSDERARWLVDYFGAKRNQVVSTNAKYVCAGDVLVDDKTSHVVKWLQHHERGLGVVWAQPYNIADTLPERAIRTLNWNDVVKSVRFTLATVPGLAG